MSEKEIVITNSSTINGANAQEIVVANNQVATMIKETVAAKEELDLLEKNLTKLKVANNACAAVAKRCRELMEDVGPKLYLA